MPNSALFRKINQVLSTIVVTLIFVLTLVNLVGTNALATQGVVLDGILKETEKLSKENQIIMVEIGKKANLGYIQSTATGLGFVRVKNNIIISEVEALAAVTKQ